MLAVAARAARGGEGRGEAQGGGVHGVDAEGGGGVPGWWADQVAAEVGP